MQEQTCQDGTLEMTDEQTVERAQQLMNYYAVEIVTYGATISRLRNLEDAWVNLKTQVELEDFKAMPDTKALGAAALHEEIQNAMKAALELPEDTAGKRKVLQSIANIRAARSTKP